MTPHREPWPGRDAAWAYFAATVASILTSGALLISGYSMAGIAFALVAMVFSVKLSMVLGGGENE